MTKLLRTLVLLLVGLLTVSMLTGCGGDDSEVEAPPVNFVSATPPSGSTIAVNSSITLTFDNTPADVTVSAGTAVPSGKTVTVNGPFFPLGHLSLVVTWADGIQTLTYTVAGLDCCVPPLVIGGTIKDGDKDVDPEAINSDGKIEIAFSEEVTGKITLLTQAGYDVGWLGKVEGSKATLELIKGREIRNNMVYIITGKVADAKGNESEFKITFFTIFHKG
jgi:hypothetical protein